MESAGRDTRLQILAGLVPLVLIQIVLQSLQIVSSAKGYGESLYLYLVYNWDWPLTKIGQFLVDYGIYFVLFMFSILIVCFMFKISFRDLGFQKTNWELLFKWGFLGGIAAFLGISALGLLINYLVPDIKPQQIEEIFRQIKTRDELLVMLLVSSVLGPLVEEIYFRGVVYNTFRKYVGVNWGIVISGLFFSTMHADLVRFIPLALGGMGLAWFYYRGRSIYVSWLAHGVWNAIMSMAVYYSLPGM